MIRRSLSQEELIQELGGFAMKLTNEMVYHYAAEWHMHGRDLYELDDGDVLVLNNGLEVKLSNDSHPEFIQGIARMLGDEEVAGVLIYGNRDAYIRFLKEGDAE